MDAKEPPSAFYTSPASARTPSPVKRRAQRGPRGGVARGCADAWGCSARLPKFVSIVPMLVPGRSSALTSPQPSPWSPHSGYRIVSRRRGGGVRGGRSFLTIDLVVDDGVIEYALLSIFHRGLLSSCPGKRQPSTRGSQVLTRPHIMITFLVVLALMPLSREVHENEAVFRWRDCCVPSLEAASSRAASHVCSNLLDPYATRRRT